MITYTVDVLNEDTNQWERQRCVFPLKWADFLDERLDEIEILPKAITKEYFNPLQIIRIRITNAPEGVFSQRQFDYINSRKSRNTNLTYDSVTKKITETIETYYLVASDNSLELLGVKTNNGLKTYKHELYGIELTKIMECFVGDSIIFTNALGHKYSKNKTEFVGEFEPYSYTVKPLEYEAPIVFGDFSFISMLAFVSNPPISTMTLSVPQGNNGTYRKFTLSEVDLTSNTETNIYTVSLTYGEYTIGEGGGYGWHYTEIEGNGAPVYHTYEADSIINYPMLNGSSNSTDEDYKPYTYSLEAGKYYKVVYGVRLDGTDFDFIGYFYAVENTLPLKKWTVTDVIIRACDLIEPLKYGEKPRFRFDGVSYDDVTGNALPTYTAGSQAEMFDNIIAPEFPFTKMLFREIMREIGGYIHGEPRVTSFDTENGHRYFNFKFDLYGGIEESQIKDVKSYVYAGFKTDVNDYCTELDTSADNLVNQLDWAQGVVIEPFNSDGASMRSETLAMRLEDNNESIYKTTLPIYQVGEDFKVYATYIPGVGTGNWDLTPYIYEEDDYKNLSSYAGSYPYVKSYALYYKQGEHDIKGMFFKSEHAVSSIFSKYALLNILRLVTGNDNLTLTTDQLLQVALRIEYLPIYGERVKTNKSVIISGLPRTIVYNQTANLVESSFLGENLKGVANRMGNVEKTYTYNLAFFSDIPRAGMLYDDDYYISTVSVEVLPTYIRCTVALSKDFNRLSEYVGISSEKRMWEVSGKQAIKRDSVLREYLLFTRNALLTDDNNTLLIQDNTDLDTTYLEWLFNGEDIGYVSAVDFKRYQKDGETPSSYYDLTLPVVSSSSGNSMTFTWAVEDNYSAGQKLSYVHAETGASGSGVSGYWGNYIPYSDYYGRFYYLGFTLLAGDMSANGGYPYDSIPNVTVSGGFAVASTEDRNDDIKRIIKYRKDSREVPQITYQLSAVTDDKSIFIGSALMKNCQFVNRNPLEMEFYVFDHKIYKLNSKIYLNWTGETKINDGITVSGSVISLPYNSSDLPSDYKAWAIVTKKSTTTVTILAENGQEINQTITTGGELVLGGNGDIPQVIYGVLKTAVYK